MARLLLARSRNVIPARARRLAAVAAMSAAGTLLLIFSIANFPNDTNWLGAFYPAGRALWEGHDPYAVKLFFNPPWLLAYLAPLTLLPSAIGRMVFLSVSAIGLFYVVLRMGASRTSLIALLLSYPVVLMFLEANVDGLALLGLLLPPQVGLFFVLVKPQVGAGIALFWLYEAWRTGKWREVIKTFAPVTVALGVSLLLFGQWFSGSASLNRASWNLNLFPYSIPVGLVLIWRSIGTRNIRFAIPASMFVSPYVGLSSWAVPLVALVSQEKFVIAASALTWLAKALLLTKQLGM